MQSISKFRSIIAVSAVLAGPAITAPAFAEAPTVVTTIKPLHSIAAAVMAGVGTPHILIDGAASPHGFALKPSQAFLLQGADAVFWIGPELTPSLEKPIAAMATRAARVEFMDAGGIQHLALRINDQFDAHDHDDHEETAEESEHDADHDHAADHDDHGHDHAGGKDPHIWLNPENGIAIAHKMAATLSDIDPDNAAVYETNADNFAAGITALNSAIASILDPVKGRKFIVFHDAYHHFEHHYGIEASGAITVTPEALSSAERISNIQNRIRSQDITCIFQEPQFDSKLVAVVLEGSDAKTGTLDPLGTTLDNGPNLYPAMLKDIAGSMVRCLN